MAMTTERLRHLIDTAKAAYDAMTPSQKLRHDYEQRRSFARGMCSSNTNYEDHCKNIDKLMPPGSQLTDAEIGLVLLGRAESQP